jgi:tellurite resistance protein TerA
MRGQKTDLTKNHPGVRSFLVGLGWDMGNTNIEVDAAAFLLQSNGKCRGDEDFVFYGNPSGRGRAITVNTDIVRSSDKAQFLIDINLIPEDVEKIAFTLTIYEGPARGHKFNQVSSSYLRVATQSDEEMVRFEMGRDFNEESAIVVAELYRHKGEWKLNPIAMGYQGGLAALCGGFGIQVNDRPSNQSQKETAATQEKPVQKSARINLQKIELTKVGQKINLEKKAEGKLGEILINLNWNQGKKSQPKGFLGSLFGSGKNGGIDLDLGCLIEMKNGNKGAIQALGKSFGSYQNYPYIALDGDDRTGAVSTGENIRINGNFIHEFKRILVYSFIYQGVACWAEADGVVTVKQPGGPDIIVKLDEHDNRKIMCAIAMIENVNNETFSVERLVSYFAGHKEMDRAFNWNMSWTSGRK